MSEGPQEGSDRAPVSMRSMSSARFVTFEAREAIGTRLVTKQLGHSVERPRLVVAHGIVR